MIVAIVEEVVPHSFGDIEFDGVICGGDSLDVIVNAFVFLNSFHVIEVSYNDKNDADKE